MIRIASCLLPALIGLCVVRLASAQAPPPPGAAWGAPVTGPGKAKEGDLVTVNGQDFRLFGIDAPDPGQKCKNVRGVEYDCFALSRTMLERLINNGEVECTPRKASPAHGPKLALCKAGGDDLARAMVEFGYALAYRALSYDYVSSEARASSYRRGMWAGRIDPPWEWRSRQLRETGKLPGG